MIEKNLSTDWSRLVAGGMFEMKGSLAVVYGYTRMLDLERLGPLTDKQRRALQEVERASRRMTGIIDALSGLAFLHRSDHSVPKVPVSLAKLLPELAALQALQDFSPVDIQIHGGYDVVLGEFNLIRQALAGLARSVAWDQLKSGTPLSIWAEHAPVTSELWVVFAPTERIQEAVNTPREHLSTLDERSGRFMDLPLAGGVVRAHGGQLLALPEGMPGAVVVLPAAESPTARTDRRRRR